MSLFLFLAGITGLLSAVLVVAPLWSAPEMTRRSKIATMLIFIVLILLCGFGLYGYLGVPMIVLFTA